ncbi:MAG TPA: hypothetical protein VGM02_09645 [Acidobacteriaceae bacterium]|jgi:heme/copper-type cytochrome/quinol oxidase subunit 2
MDEDRGTAGGNAMNEQEIGERIALIESMMQAGRKTTEYWGWTFLLWGIAYLVAVAWSRFLQAGGPLLAWPVTMIFAALLTIGIARRRSRHKPQTEKSRGVEAIWTAMGCGIFVFAFPVAFSGHYQAQSFMAAIEVMLGIANVGSGIFLRWPAQIVVGVLWWAAAIASCFVSGNGVVYVFLAATFVCMIGFGIYLMIRESRDKARARGGVQVQHG